MEVIMKNFLPLCFAALVAIPLTAVSNVGSTSTPSGSSSMSPGMGTSHTTTPSSRTTPGSSSHQQREEANSVKDAGSSSHMGTGVKSQSGSRSTTTPATSNPGTDARNVSP